MTKAEVMAQKSKERKYDFDFEKDLSINKYKLDEECLSHSSIYFRYAEACVSAKSEVSKADNNLKLVKAEANISIRQDYAKRQEKFTEAVILSEIEKHPKVVAAQKELNECQEVYARLQVAVQAMDARRSELDNLVRLYCAGYYSTPGSGTSTKKDINEQTAKDVRKNLNKNN